MSTQIKTILLAGDDGYNSLGTRLLIHFLKDKYELFVTGTTTQQSGVGGCLSLKNGFNYGATTIDGVEVLWVDGSPADTMEIMASHPKAPFDLTISGINWGANLGSAIFSSGTCNVALRAPALNVSKYSIAMSWDLPPEAYLMHHDGNHELDEYLEYPGKLVAPMLEKICENDFWQSRFLNINFPQRATKEIMLTKSISNIKDIYDFSGYSLNPEGGHYMYAGKRLYKEDVTPNVDVHAITQGCVAITPCKFDVMNDPIVEKVAGQKISME
jgi:5'-nucleotidase